jgi:hypothetical protein
MGTGRASPKGDVVQSHPIEDLKLYSKREVAARAGLGVRTVDRHIADPDCPLKPAARRCKPKEKVCGPEMLRAYLAWLVELPAVDVAPPPVPPTKKKSRAAG